jgi:hypothetical protein
MPNTSDRKPDFFISYNQADRRWANWIAWILDAAGYSVFLGTQEFLDTQENFVSKTTIASGSATRTIVILSPNYLNSLFTASEWTAAFSMDPGATGGRLIVLRVEECEPSTVIGPISFIDLVGVKDEDAASAVILSGIHGHREKPSARPEFPRAPLKVQLSPFPGSRKLNIAVLFAGKDERIVDQLLTHTVSLFHSYDDIKLEIYNINKITSAEDSIADHAQIRVALFIVSPDLLASEYI